MPKEIDVRELSDKRLILKTSLDQHIIGLEKPNGTRAEATRRPWRFRGRGAGGTRRQILRSSLSDPIWGVTRQDEFN